MNEEVNYWNAAYLSGTDYREISPELLVKIINETGNPSSVLDLGCGTGDFMRKMEALGITTVGIDFSNEALAIARKMDTLGSLLQYDLDDAKSIMLDQKFDLICIKLVLAFVHQKHSLLKWCKEKLVEDGFVIINTPISGDKNVCLKPGIEIDKNEIVALLNECFSSVKLIDEDQTPVGQIETYVCRR